MAEAKAVLQIEGMTCDGCAQAIQYSLKRKKRVKQDKVNWRTGQGEVTFDTEETSELDILENPAFRHYKASLIPSGGCC